MANGALSDRIENPEMWNLLLRFSQDALHVVLYSIIEDNSLIYRRFDISATTDSWIDAIQNVIYDNPALLSDFRRVYCVVETRNYIAIPAQCESDDSRNLLFSAAFPSSKLEMAVNEIGAANGLILMGIEPELRRFINRTFRQVTIVSHIASLCRYAIANGHLGNKVKMIANLRQGAVDVVVTTGRRLLLANTFSFTEPDDAVYYILASRQRLKLDELNDELHIAGDQNLRELVMQQLRKFIARVMPIIFPPQMFKAGKDSMLAPFDLITQPICE